VPARFALAGRLLAPEASAVTSLLTGLLPCSACNDVLEPSGS